MNPVLEPFALFAVLLIGVAVCLGLEKLWDNHHNSETARRARLPAGLEAHAALHRIATLESEIYGQIVSDSIRDHLDDCHATPEWEIEAHMGMESIRG